MRRSKLVERNGRLDLEETLNEVDSALASSGPSHLRAVDRLGEEVAEPETADMVFTVDESEQASRDAGVEMNDPRAEHIKGPNTSTGSAPKDAPEKSTNLQPRVTRTSPEDGEEVGWGGMISSGKHLQSLGEKTGNVEGRRRLQEEDADDRGRLRGIFAALGGASVEEAFGARNMEVDRMRAQNTAQDTSRAANAERERVSRRRDPNSPETQRMTRVLMDAGIDVSGMSAEEIENNSTLRALASRANVNTREAGQNSRQGVTEDGRYGRQAQGHENNMERDAANRAGRQSDIELRARLRRRMGGGESASSAIAAEASDPSITDEMWAGILQVPVEQAQQIVARARATGNASAPERSLLQRGGQLAMNEMAGQTTDQLQSDREARLRRGEEVRRVDVALSQAEQLVSGSSDTEVQAAAFISGMDPQSFTRQTAMAAAPSHVQQLVNSFSRFGAQELHALSGASTAMAEAVRVFSSVGQGLQDPATIRAELANGRARLDEERGAIDAAYGHVADTAPGSRPNRRGLGAAAGTAPGGSPAQPTSTPGIQQDPSGAWFYTRPNGQRIPITEADARARLGR